MKQLIHPKPEQPIIVFMIILLVLAGTNRGFSQSRQLQQARRSVARAEVNTLSTNALTLTQGGDDARDFLSGNGIFLDSPVGTRGLALAAPQAPVGINRGNIRIEIHIPLFHQRAALGDRR